MTESQELSALISDIYDTTLQQSSWPRVLERICAFLQTSTASIFFQPGDNSSASLYSQWNRNPDYDQLYFEKYHKINPVIPALLLFEAGKVYSQSDVLPASEFYETRFYREWVKPQGYIDIMAAILERSLAGVGGISTRCQEKDGFIDDEKRFRLSLLIPHLQKAVSIARIMDFHEAGSRTLTDTLATIPSGIFLLNAEGVIAFANIAGQRMLHDGRLMREYHGLLFAACPSAHQALQDALGRFNRGDSAYAKNTSIALTGQDGEGWLAHILPLTSGQRRNATAALSAVAAVFVRKATVHVPSGLETMAKLYKLTPSELRVLQASLDGAGGIAATAASLGISANTVKRHLQNLFEKTGTRRQADLVLMVARTANPFAA